MQVVPHITNEIKERMQLLGNSGDFDIIITEIGGTVGDIESLPYIESVRQLIYELGEENAMVIHLTLIPLSICCRRAENKANSTFRQNSDGKWNQSRCFGL